MFGQTLASLWTMDSRQWFFLATSGGNVTDWGDLDMNLYPNAESAKMGHELTCKVWADVTVNDNYEIIEAVI